MLALSPTDGKIKWGFQYTPNDPYDFDEISEHPIINAKVNGEDRKLVVHAARNGFFYALDRTNGSFVAGKQYVDKLNWTPGLDPKTGPPLNYDPNAGVQVYAGSHGMRGEPARRARRTRRQELGTDRLQSELGLLYIPSIEGCNLIETVEQKDFADQGGTLKPRERFSGGSSKNPTASMAASRRSIRPQARPRPTSSSPTRTIRGRSRLPATSCSSATRRHLHGV